MSSVGRVAPVVADRWVLGVLVVAVVGAMAAYAALGVGQAHGPRPGDALPHLLAVAGSLLMATGLLYPLVKRSAALGSLKPWWHQGHLLLGALGAALVALHVSGRLDKAPALVSLAVLGLVIMGAYGRLLSGRLVHTAFARDLKPFLPAAAGVANPLREIARRKAGLAARLDPSGSEAVFSLSPGHWLRHPVASAQFTRLAMAEERLVSARRAVPGGVVGLVQRNWRLFHLVLVFLMGIGLLSHVAAVLFFAGYVAEGGEVYWWHLRK